MMNIEQIMELVDELVAAHLSDDETADPSCERGRLESALREALQPLDELVLLRRSNKSLRDAISRLDALLRDGRVRGATMADSVSLSHAAINAREVLAAQPVAVQPHKEELDAAFERGRAYGITQVIDKLRYEKVSVRTTEEKP